MDCLSTLKDIQILKYGNHHHGALRNILTYQVRPILCLTLLHPQTSSECQTQPIPRLIKFNHQFARTFKRVSASAASEEDRIYLS